MKNIVSEYDGIETISPVWHVLTEEQLYYLNRHCIVRRFKKNELVYSEGEESTHVVCVAKGKLKIYRKGAGGRSQIVRVVKPGEMCAYRAMFAGEPFVTNASAIEASELYMISQDVIKTLLSQNFDLAWYFISKLSFDLGVAEKHVKGRLAESLIFLRDNFGFEEDGKTLAANLSREDIANLSNMTTSNAIRTLSWMAKENIVEVDGRKIKFVDEEYLTCLSKNG